MFKVLVLAAALCATAAVPAFADRYGPQGGYPQAGRSYDAPVAGPRIARALPARELARALRYQGFVGADIVNRRGDVTIVRAVSRGRDFVLVVDSFSGDVLRARAVGNTFRAAYGWHGGWGADWRRW